MTTDALKTTSKRVIQKTVETTDELVGKKIAEKITEATLKNLKNPKKSEPNATTKMPKEIIIPSEKKLQIIDELRLL